MNIYLCGPIRGLDISESNNWRLSAEQQLSGDFVVLNPLRRNFRGTEFQSQNEIVQLDKTDIMNADILLVNGTKPGWGTAMEVLFGFIHHKSVIAYTCEPYENTSPWLAFHSTRVTETLDEACDYILRHFP